MNESELATMLHRLVAGEVNIHHAISQLKNTIFRTTELGFARPDHHRELRLGLSEVIYGQNKTIKQIIQIALPLSEQQRCILISRLNAKKLSALKNQFPKDRANEIAGTFMINAPAILPVEVDKKFVAIISAGTSDIHIAEEASEVCVAMKIPVQPIYDVGVAGLHRVLASMEIMQKAAVIIVIAGMEGALPSVIGGLIGCPVIAVPTSIGYGTSFQGIAALLGMLNSCAPGVVVTNIDAGFSAGFAAARIVNGINRHENSLS